MTFLLRAVGRRSAVSGRMCLAVLAAVALMALAACARPTATPSAPTPPAGTSAPLPDTAVTAVIRPREGGVVALRDGAGVTLPRDAVSDTAVATLRAVSAPPQVPIPRSLVGRAYQFSLEGGQLTGVATFLLPLPESLDPSQYELGVYRWSGRAWERVTSRRVGQGLQCGVDAPALLAVLGQWRLADASLALGVTAGDPGQASVAMTVAGQYRYSALPAMQHDYIQAHLRLKRDSSGGAGQVRGDDSLDQTVADALLWFEPDPGRSQGLIEFSHSFQLAPGDLDVPPGGTGRFYATLMVEDSEAPTRQMSVGAEYTQILSIRVVENREIVRPKLANEQPGLLRWNVRLDGRPFLQPAATGITLSLTDVMSQGGIGEYRIALEAQSEGKYRPVSNEITVQLQPPVTATPSPTATLPPELRPSATLPPVVESPTPGGAAFATPTPRATPAAGTPTATAGPAATPTSAAATSAPTAVRPDWAAVFWADRYVLASGECTTLHWHVENVREVYLNGDGTTGTATRRVCLTDTATYKLSAVGNDGSQTDRYLTITVQTGGQPAIVFTADTYDLTSGACTVLRWRATDVKAVYLDGQGQAGESYRKVCPEETTEYELLVEPSSGSSITKRLTITVYEANTILMRFWSEQYSVAGGDCTVLRWSVRDVQAVYLTADGEEEGVAGVDSREVCPTYTHYYTLRAVAADKEEASQELTITVNPPGLSATEIIAHGLINDLTYQTDLLPDKPGDQAGWRLLVDGINPLFRGTGTCCQAVVTLAVLRQQTGSQGGDRVDWPLNQGQQIEFRAFCQGNACSLIEGTAYYLRLRSE